MPIFRNHQNFEERQEMKFQFLIKLDNATPGSSYYAGQFVDGSVVIANNRPVDVKEIKISLEGKGYVHWAPLVASRNSHRGVSTSTVHYTAEESIIAFEHNLAGHDHTGNSITLPEGVAAYPFHIQLPHTLPSTFKGKFGDITHIIKGEMKMMGFRRVTQVPITIYGRLDLNLESGAILPQQCSRMRGPNTFLCRKGEIHLLLNLPTRSGFIPGEPIDFRAEITNGSNKKITRVVATLCQLTTFYAGCISTTESKTVGQITGMVNNEREYNVWAPRFKIPGGIPPTGLGGGGSRVIDVKYFLNSEISVSGWSDPIVGKLPVVIGTIPLRSSYQHAPSAPINVSPEPHLIVPSPGQFYIQYKSNINSRAMEQQQIHANLDQPPPSYAEAMADQLRACSGKLR